MVFACYERQVGCQWPNLDIRERQRSHRLAVWVMLAVPFEDRFAPSDDLSAYVGRLRRILVMRGEGYQVAAVPCLDRTREHRAYLIGLSTRQLSTRKQKNPAEHIIYPGPVKSLVTQLH